MNRVNIFYLLLFIVGGLVFFTCASSEDSRVWKPEPVKLEPEKKREERILNIYSNQNDEKFASLLVPVDKYTTSGRIFHEKYHRFLISIAVDIVENRGLKVADESIGFYYDRVSKDRSRLYLGLDINTGKNVPEDYRTAARRWINSDLRKIIDTVNSCRSIFNEELVVGMVIGWKWNTGVTSQLVSVWIVKEDFIAFEESRLTFQELVRRATITDTEGKIIILAK